MVLVWYGILYLPSSQRLVESGRRGAWPLHSGWAWLGFPGLGLDEPGRWWAWTVGSWKLEEVRAH